ncbi:hypothetical protein HDU96_010554 [Phlyctochytrium bullatum]|nr:hypothetical protein HDU96_010554 [Phlyctochytrium bullatum]
MDRQTDASTVASTATSEASAVKKTLAEVQLLTRRRWRLLTIRLCQIPPRWVVWSFSALFVATKALQIYWSSLATGNPAKLRSILSEKLVDVESTEDGLTGLQYACRENLVDVVKTLLEFGADHQKKDENGQLTIQLSSSVEIWRALATVMPIPDGDLFDAATKGDDVSARLILAVAPDPLTTLNELRELELMKGSAMPLHVAAKNGHAAVCRVFLEMGAEIDCRTDRMNTPLHSAAAKGHISVAKLLIEKGADIESQNFQNSTPLLFAVNTSQLNMVRFLLESGADIENKGYRGRSPLFEAAYSRRL